MFRDILKRSGTSQIIVEHSRTLSKFVECSGTLWTILDFFMGVTTQFLLNDEGKNRKINEKYEVVQWMNKKKQVKKDPIFTWKARCSRYNDWKFRPLKILRTVQNIREYSRVFHIIPEYSGMFWNITEHPRSLWNIQEHSRSFWNALELCRQFESFL